MKKTVKAWWIFTLIFFGACFIYLVSMKQMPWYILLPIIPAYFILNYLIFWGTSLGITGYFFQSIGKIELALKFYQLAIRFKTRSAYALAAYGLILIREGKPSEALPLFQRMQELNPTIMMDKVAITNIAVCQWKMGKIDQAIITLEKLRGKYDYISADVYTTLGFLYLLKGDIEKAEEYTNKALEDSPSHGPALDNLGQIYFRQENFEKAEEYFKKALEEKETMADSKYYLGLIYEQQGNTELAKEYFTAAYNSKITPLNTITQDEVEEKYQRYV